MTDFVTRRTILGGLALVAAPPLTIREHPMPTLEYLEGATEGAAAAYMSGTADIEALYSHVAAQFKETTAHAQTRQREVDHVRAWQGALLGALAAGRGQLPLAKGWALTVRSLGQHSGDAQAVSRAYIAAAQLELWPGGDPAKAAALAEEGLHLTRPQQREQHARLAALLMEARAKLGHPGFSDAVVVARRAHAHLDAKPSTLFGFSSQQMHAAMAMALADVGDRSAVHHAEMSIIRFPHDAPAVRTLAEYPKAYALARTGSPSDAVGVALAAITSAGKPSWLAQGRARWVLSGLPEDYSSAEADALRDIANAS